MINNINKNPYNMNPYTNIPTKINGEIKQAQNNFQEIDKNLLKQIKEQIQNAELIAIKMIKGERLTTNEKKFISEKYPDIKETAEQSIKESKSINKQLKNFKTDEERQQFLSKIISNIKAMGKNGVLSEIQVKIKLSSIEEVEKLFQKDKLEIKKAEIIAVKIVKGEKLTANEKSFISEKYPDIKKTAEQSIKESKNIKEQLKSFKTDEEKQQFLSKIINDVKSMGKKGVLSETQVKIKLKSIEEVEKFFKKDKLENKKAEIIATKLVKGEKLTSRERNFITEKYPDIKQIAEQSVKESKGLKEQIQNLKTDDEKHQLLSKVINDLEVMGEKGILSEIQIKFSILSIEKIKKEINKEKELNFTLNPYIYTILEYSLGNLAGIIIFIIVIVGFLYLI